MGSDTYSPHDPYLDFDGGELMKDHWFLFNFRCWLVAASVLVLILSSGCSRDELKQAYEDAKVKTQELASSTKEAVEAQLPATGAVTLRTTPAMPPTTGATLELISIGDGRPSVLQVTSYDPGNSTKTYPSILLHGTTAVGSVESLAGTKIQCDMYLRVSRTMPIAITANGKPATVTFSGINAEEKTITATIEPVELIGSDGKSIQVLGGDLVAVIGGGN